MTQRRVDVIVVGGGPAGATAAWALARRGVNVTLVDRARFPREKVCGDYLEPAALRIARAMSAPSVLPGSGQPVIRRNSVYFGPHRAWSGSIPYYDGADGLPDHGMIVPRTRLDAELLAAAAAAGAVVREDCAVASVTRDAGLMQVALANGELLTAPLVVGADGVESVVARSMGIVRRDRRHIGIARRLYLEGLDIAEDEAVVWFDDDQIPGYGWLFPTGCGGGNVGVGLLSEAASRQDLLVPATLEDALKRLAIRHPGCGKARPVGPPVGGIVKAYGAITTNHFAGGLLVGDAGCFADPITGEGISQGMESAVIATRTLMAALASGRFEAADLARFDREFRAHFDPGMRWLGFCAALMRNWHFRHWLWRITRRGFEEAARNPDFARVAGSGFGGLDIRPRDIIVQLWSRVFSAGLEDGIRLLAALIAGRPPRGDGLAGDVEAWQRAWRESLADDPAFHARWLADLGQALFALIPALRHGGMNPRRVGLEL